MQAEQAAAEPAAPAVAESVREKLKRELVKFGDLRRLGGFDTSAGEEQAKGARQRELDRRGSGFRGEDEQSCTWINVRAGRLQAVKDAAAAKSELPRPARTRAPR